MDFVGLDKFSLLDYDEMISIVLFAPKCNFRCPFCHNIKNVVDSNYRIPFNQIIEYLKDRKNVIDAVVISGGEPTLMDDLYDKIKQIKNIGYKIKLDTNGTNSTIVKKLIDDKLIDYVAMDIKSSLDNYHLLTGVTRDFSKIKETIELLKQDKVDYEFRTTLIDEYHDEDDIKKIGSLLIGAKKLYLQKFVMSDDVINKNLHPVNEEKANKYKSILKQYVQKVELRGY
ncbi:MAG TPA: anaerobic ribonucleoside-triphosphate reductase activating protein [Firmicutes bacterium]|nr:anaerobic ribonucleoside-triphosphate reductase activating protein [Bacillota bacterium]